MDNAPATPEGGRHLPCKRAVDASVLPAQFHLVRYFALTSLLGVLLVLALLIYAYRHFATEALEEHETRDNVAITHIFASTLWPLHSAHVKNAAALSPQMVKTCLNCYKPPIAPCRMPKSRGATTKEACRQNTAWQQAGMAALPTAWNWN